LPELKKIHPRSPIRINYLWSKPAPQSAAHFQTNPNNHQFAKPIVEIIQMRAAYDFTKARKNPYAAQLNKQITIRLGEDSIGYFKGIWWQGVWQTRSLWYWAWQCLPLSQRPTCGAPSRPLA
jgi:uncharacterized protein (DUF4415 family)